MDELTGSSDAIAAGKVTQSWSGWDVGHHYIWTHYRVEISATQKGVLDAAVELSEPGGVADGVAMTVAGAVAYKIGDEVLVFMQKMPNGMTRTTGWGQGKYTVDSHGRMRAEVAPRGVDFVNAEAGDGAVSSETSLEGLTLEEAGLRVAARVRAAQRTRRVGQ